MSPIKEISIKANVKELAREIPVEVFVYEYSLDDIMNQLVKIFGKEVLISQIDETVAWMRAGGKL
jgi:hypothetical protein